MIRKKWLLFSFNFSDFFFSFWFSLFLFYVQVTIHCLYARITRPKLLRHSSVTDFCHLNLRGPPLHKWPLWTPWPQAKEIETERLVVSLQITIMKALGLARPQGTAQGGRPPLERSNGGSWLHDLCGHEWATLNCTIAGERNRVRETPVSIKISSMEAVSVTI